MRKILGLSALCVAFLAACHPSSEPIGTQGGSSSFSSVAIHGFAIYHPADPDGQIMMGLEIADTPELREKGMMGRTGFGPNQGMLFSFEKEQRLSFWMKNTIIPMDIVFFDKDATFVSATSMVPCDADPCPIYDSVEPALTAVELPSGFLKKYPVGKGWKLRAME